MLETRFMASMCDKCKTSNDIPLSYFLSFDYKFEKVVIATCKAYNGDFVVTLDDSLIH